LLGLILTLVILVLYNQFLPKHRIWVHEL
jgi:hypothetical protein